AILCHQHVGAEVLEDPLRHFPGVVHIFDDQEAQSMKSTRVLDHGRTRWGRPVSVCDHRKLDGHLGASSWARAHDCHAAALEFRQALDDGESDAKPLMIAPRAVFLLSKDVEDDRSPSEPCEFEEVLDELALQ